MAHINNAGYAVVDSDPNLIAELQTGHSIKKAIHADGREWNFVDTNLAGNKWVIGGGASSLNELSDATRENGNLFLGDQAGDDTTTGIGNILIGDNIQTDTPIDNNKLNIGDLIKGDRTTGETELIKLTLTGLNTGSFNDKILMLNESNEVESISLERYVNLKVFNSFSNTSLSTSGTTNQTADTTFGSIVAGAIKDNGLSRATIIGSYGSAIASGSTGTILPSSLKYEYSIKILNGFFTASTGGSGAVTEKVLFSRETTDINTLNIVGKTEENFLMTTQSQNNIPSTGWNIMRFYTEDIVDGVSTNSTDFGFLRNATNTATLIGSEALFEFRVRITKTYANSADVSNHNYIFNRSMVGAYLERIK